MRNLHPLLVLTILFFLSCNCYSQSSRSVTKDFDGDGFLSFEHGGTDCNDLNFRINPAAKPKMNGSDCNCNGIADYQETVFEFADVNQSDRIDVIDLCAVLESYGVTGDSDADVTKDLVVDENDLNKLITKYNSLTFGF